MIQTTLYQSFSNLPDPRINRRKLHNLLDIIILSILAVLCGAESYDSKMGEMDKVVGNKQKAKSTSNKQITK